MITPSITSLSRLSGGKGLMDYNDRMLDVSKPPIRREGFAGCLVIQDSFSKPPIRREGEVCVTAYS